VQELPLTAPRVLGLMLDQEPSLGLEHISRVWSRNVLAD